MIEKRYGGRLPHWRLPKGLYFVTFRLHDALPVDHVRAIREWVLHEEARERARLGRPLTTEERAWVRARSTGRLDRSLDEGHGECLLRRPGAAEALVDVMRRGAGYRLFAWAAMPNHAHAIVHPEPHVDVSDVVGAWKSISAREIIRRHGVQAPVWQREPFDHLVRNEVKAQAYTRYVLDNPVKAGLRDWPHVGSADYGYDGVVWPFHE